MKYNNRKKEPWQGFCKEKDPGVIPLSNFEVRVDPRKELLAVGIDVALQVMADEFKLDVEMLCGLRYHRPEGRQGSYQQRG